MLWLINLLRGRVTVEVTGAYPERFINLCASHVVAFWGLEWIDDTSFRVTVAFWNWKKVRELAVKAMCELSPPRMTGLPAAALRMKRRYAFIVGMALCLLTLAVVPQFILSVEVTGNGNVPTAVILSELRRLGVKTGAYAPGLDEKKLANEALLSLDELSFLAINIKGCRAEVTVREAERTPELLAQDVPADIVSVADGIVLDVQPSTGQALVDKGSTVMKGDVLITGFMDLPEYTFSETDMGTYIVHAAGTVTARTWRTLKSTISLSTQVKDYAGASRTFWSVNFFGRRLNFYQNSGISYDRYDKITETAILTLPGSVELPVSVTRETVREYAVAAGELNEDAAAAMLEDGLRRELDDILQETDGECVRLDYTVARDGDMLTVTLLAECVEQIGRTVLREGETGFIPGAGAQESEAGS